MKTEDKELLLRDLCARLPYGVKVKTSFNKIDEPIELKSININNCTFAVGGEYTTISGISFDTYICKPYLLPLLRMTKEQKKFFDDKNIELDGWEVVSKEGSHYQSSCYTDIEDWLEVIDWLNKNYFDYRGLIEKGLAIDATNLGIYK